MFDSFINILFVIAAVGFFVIRTVVQAKKKQGEAEAPPPQPHIPVHFEDDDDEDDPEYFRNKTPVQTPAPTVPRAPRPVFTPLLEPVFKTALNPAPAVNPKPPSFGIEPRIDDATFAGARQAPETPEKSRGAVPLAPAVGAPGTRMAAAAKSAAVAGTVRSGQKDFFLYLSRLPPMKQAVVMAEVLGTPKGMQ